MTKHSPAKIVAAGLSVPGDRPTVTADGFGARAQSPRGRAMADGEKTSGSSDTAGAGELVAARSQNGIYALGLAARLLQGEDHFAGIPFGEWTAVLAGMIARNHYFFVLEGERVVGLAGWALAAEADADAWLEGAPAPDSESCTEGDCAILNVWLARGRRANRFMEAELARALSGKKALYAKRPQADGSVRPVRLSITRRTRNAAA